MTKDRDLFRAFFLVPQPWQVKRFADHIAMHGSAVDAVDGSSTGT
jgi:hypothetical protein